ncbi:MAG TPA: multiheme c-type cytochrome [Blastocatellia bacterium]|nr:multiheme c-type cytochrome [Blastocatellia bacterium]
MTNRIKKALVLVTFTTICVGGSSFGGGQGAAQDNDPLSNWRPSHDPSGIRYVGSSKCSECHKGKGSTQPGTPMAHALEPIADCQVLTAHPRLTFRNGPYTYQITRQGNRSIYSVTDGEKTISEPILYCLGSGKVGQTYILRHNDLFYESRVSYYQPIQNLDFTIGQPRLVPSSVEEAFGRPLGLDEARDCFACHAPAAVVESRLQLDPLIPGVNCEACHGPGEKHVKAVASGSKGSQIFNPGKMDAFSLSQEFCGTCHRSFDQVMLMPAQGGVNNIRFQPYRMFNSRGHNKLDPRTSCVACHDPHDKLEHDAARYDSTCLACHLKSPTEAKTDKRKAAACPVGKQQCTDCHMPKLEIPGTHFKFTDHWIRIVKPNDPIPR